MADSSFNSSSGSSSSSTVPVVVNTPASDWELQLAQSLQQVAQSQAQWAAQQFARTSQVTDQQINNYLATAQQGSQLAGGVLDRYNNLYGPQADQYAREAGTYASNGRIQNNMGRAESGVMQAGRQAEINAEQELQSFGIDPSSGRYQDLVRASKTADAAAAAGAGENARLATEAEGTRRRETAMNYGAQLPGAAVNAMNAAYQGIAGAENAALGNANTGVNLTTSPNQFDQTAMQLKYPPTGNQTTGKSNSGSVGGSNGGGGGGGSKSQGFPATPQSQSPGLPHSGGNVPAYSNPNGNFSSAAPGSQFRQVGQGSMVGPEDQQDMGGYNPSNPYSTLDPWSQGEGGVLGDNGYGQGFPQYDQSVGGGQQYYDPGQNYWNPGNYGGSTYGGDLTNPTTDFPDVSQGGGWGGDTVGSYGDAGSSYGGNSGYDTSGWDTSGGGDLGSWDSSSTQDWNTGSADWGGDGNYGYDGYAKGGAVGGGAIPASMSPSGGQQVDDVQAQIPQTGGKAMLNVDEFVIPRDVAMWKGQEFFQKLIAQSRQARTGAPAKPSKGGPNAA